MKRRIKIVALLIVVLLLLISTQAFANTETTQEATPYAENIVIETTEVPILAKTVYYAETEEVLEMPLVVEETYELSVSKKDDNAEITVDDENMLQISDDGTIKAINTGKTVLHVTIDGYTIDFPVTVDINELIYKNPLTEKQIEYIVNYYEDCAEDEEQILLFLYYNDAVIPAEIFKLAKDTGLDLTVESLGIDSLETVWRFDASSISNTNIDLPLRIDRVDAFNQDLETEDYNVLYLDFAHSGELPGTAEINVIVNEEDAVSKLQGKDNIKIYYYNETTNKTEDAKDVTVSEINGLTLSFSLEHCSRYVVVDEDLVPTEPETGNDDTSNNDEVINNTDTTIENEQGTATNAEENEEEQINTEVSNNDKNKAENKEENADNQNAKEDNKNSTDRELDETPRTGTVDFISVAIAVVAISILGIGVMCYKK